MEYSERCLRMDGGGFVTGPDGHAPDESLVASTLAGDDDSFAELVRRYKGMIFAIAVNFSADNQELDDICQETFLKAYRCLRKFRRDSSLGYWLSRIAVRTCLDSLRRKKAEGERVPLERMAYTLGEGGAPDRLSPEQARETVNWGLAKLPPEDRLVITLINLEGMSIREVTGLTGWTESKVKVRAFRARKLLKKILEENDER